MTTVTEDTNTPSRYVVGIDLGTTNSAVAYVDTTAIHDDGTWQVRTLPIPQLVAAGQSEPRETLPSFHYEATAAEISAGAVRLPWDKNASSRNHAVGVYARDHGETVPGRVVSSAKSWLCHTGVDRTAELLPWHGAADVQRLSPVDVSSRYLQHIREVWDQKFAKFPLAEQDIVLTLPASFDEVARELTIKAARQAGLARVVLVEEPQAAFYAWIHGQGNQWENVVQPGQKILVCDIGGGTSDFTLIRVRKNDAVASEPQPANKSETNKVQFHRVAVGEHLILGGDNLDLALAHHLEGRLAGDGKLEPRQWAMLVRLCRQVKETLLGDAAPAQLTVSLPGSGSKLIGGARQIEVTRDEVRQVLVEGFLPRVALADKPESRRSGFQEFGLPYATDAAMTRYLAAFLTAHRHVAIPTEAAATVTDHDPARPDIVLFNGGFFASPELRARLLEVLAGWFPNADGSAWQPLVLENPRLDLAVARGAAYYGMVRRGVGVRISAGLARSYYIGVNTAGDTGQDNEQLAVCLVPAGVEEGQQIELGDRKFELLIQQPVEFPLFVSSTRLTDRAGELLPADPEQMTALPPIRTVLQASKKEAGTAVTVNLHAQLTEIGTLDLWCAEVDGRRTWRLQFDVRAATHTDISAHTGTAEQQGMLEESTLASVGEILQATFSSNDKNHPPQSLVKRLEAALGLRRTEWPSSLLRAMWEQLIDLEKGRKLSAEHEARWLYLVGFSLRPGYGYALDDWRVARTWRLLHGKRAFHTPNCRVEWLILWRRVAGGMLAGWQRALAEPLLGTMRPTPGKARGTDLGLGSHEAAEVWRLLGSLELLPQENKVELGDLALYRAAREKNTTVRSAQLWAIARLGARVPFYGPLNTVLAPDVAARWLRGLLDMRGQYDSLEFPVFQLARRTGDRYRDIDEPLRKEVLNWLAAYQVPDHQLELVREGGTLAAEEQAQAFGESLPSGLRVSG